VRLLAYVQKVHDLTAACCEIIFIRQTFIFVFFVRRDIHVFKIPNIFIHFSYIALTFKFTNSSVNEHVKPQHFVPS